MNKVLQLKASIQNLASLKCFLHVGNLQEALLVPGDGSGNLSHSQSTELPQQRFQVLNNMVLTSKTVCIFHVQPKQFTMRGKKDIIEQLQQQGYTRQELHNLMHKIVMLKVDQQKQARIKMAKRPFGKAWLCIVDLVKILRSKGRYLIKKYLIK